MKSICLNKLKSQREFINWSQEMLSEYSGVSVRTIQRVESGSRTSIESAKALASALSLSSYSLLLQPQVVDGDNNEGNIGVSSQDATLGEFVRETLVQGQALLFTFNLAVSSLLLLFLPMYLNGIFPSFNISALLFIAALAMYAIFASRSAKHSFLHTVLFGAIFLLIQWLNNSPTKGIWTTFYTSSQIEHFQAIEELRSSLGSIRETIQDFQRGGGYDDLSLNLDNSSDAYSSETAWSVYVGATGQLFVETNITKDIGEHLPCEWTPSLNGDGINVCTVQ
jgi:transcriptional regulator with XRE-family HTH domain